MPPTTELESRYDRRRTIVASHNISTRPAEIHRETGYPESSIRLIVANYHKRGHTHDLPQSGHPPTLNSPQNGPVQEIDWA